MNILKIASTPLWAQYVYHVHNDVDAVSRFEFERIDIANTLQLANQPIASESERACDQCQSTAVTPRVCLSCSFLSCIFNWLYCYRQLTVSIGVSAVGVFRLVGDIMPSRLHIVHWNNYKLKNRLYIIVSHETTSQTRPVQQQMTYTFYICELCRCHGLSLQRIDDWGVNGNKPNDICSSKAGAFYVLGITTRDTGEQ